MLILTIPAVFMIREPSQIHF